MRNPRLANVYAKSLIEFAQQQNQLDAAYTDMQYIIELCKASKEFDYVLASPIISEDKKLAAVSAVVKANVSQQSWAFITLVLKKNRANYLAQIAGAYVEQYNKLKGIHEVSLTTALPIDAALQNSIIDKLKQEAGFKSIQLTSKIDPSIIGGFILEFNNNLIDASVSKKLNDLKLIFQNNNFVAAI
jgi:F-type H+-transporting ATPase subunit delta